MPFRFTDASVFPDKASRTFTIDWAGEGVGTFQFGIEQGPNSDGPWTPASPDLYSAPVVTLHLPDAPLSHVDSVWFRIKAFSGPSVVGISSPFDCGFRVNKHEYLKYREMLRRYNLELKKFTAHASVVLRVKTFGELAQNVHPILNKPIGTEDKSGGLKYKGGYLAPIEMWGAYEDTPPDGTKKVSKEATGASEVEKQVIYTMPFPVLKTDDVWVDPISNTRYRIEVADPVEFRGMAVKQILQASRLPVTDPAYKFPIK